MSAKISDLLASTVMTSAMVLPVVDPSITDVALRNQKMNMLDVIKGTMRALATNGCTFPVSTQNSTTNVRHNILRRRAAGPASLTWTKLRAGYANFWVGNGGEYNVNAVTIRMSFMTDAGGIFQGVFVPAASIGCALAPIDANNPNGEDVIVQPGGFAVFETTCSVNGGDDYTEVCRVVGQSGTYTYLNNQGGTSLRGTGFVGGTDLSIDLTKGDSGIYGVGIGARLRANLSGGALNSLSVLAGGQRYKSVGSAYFLTYEEGARNANYALNTGSGAVTSGFQNSAGSGYTIPPEVFAWGFGNNLLPGNSQVYGASIIDGIPSDPSLAYGLMVIGDSIGRGFTSADSLGDPKGNFGSFERLMDSKYGILNLAVSSMTLQAFVRAKQYASIDAMRATGLRIHGAYIQGGANDVTGGSTYNFIADTANALRNELTARGIDVGFCTLTPLTTSQRRLATLPTIANGGSGYAASATFDVTISGGTLSGTGGASSVVSVTTNASGVVTTVNSITNRGKYSAAPGTPSATTGGTGTGLTLNTNFKGWYNAADQTGQTGGATGGVREAINTNIRLGVDPRYRGNLPFIDFAAASEDPASPFAWLGDPSDPLTNDGTHPEGNQASRVISGTTFNYSQDSGIDRVRKKLAPPALTAYERGLPGFFGLRKSRKVTVTQSMMPADQVLYFNATNGAIDFTLLRGIAYQDKRLTMKREPGDVSGLAINIISPQIEGGTSKLMPTGSGTGFELEYDVIKGWYLVGAF